MSRRAEPLACLLASRNLGDIVMWSGLVRQLHAAHYAERYIIEGFMDETDPAGYEPSGASASASQKVGVARAARRGARRHTSILRCGPFRLKPQAKRRARGSAVVAMPNLSTIY
jgi:hypothetical protein